MTAPLKVDRAFLEPLAVGASEVGAVMGCDPWTSPLQLWRRKRHLDPPRADTPAMSIGRALEGPVVGIARDRIPLRIRRNRSTFAHPVAPLFATPDAFVGRDRLLEVKVVGIHGTNGWDDGELPCRVRLQVQAQLAVTGRAAAYVGALVGTELRLVVVEADAAVQAGILESVTAFVVDHLDPGYPPDPLSWDERWAQLLADADELPVADVLAGQALQDAGDRILEVRALEAQLADEVAELRAELVAGLVAGAGRRLVANGWLGTLEVRAGRTDWRFVATELLSVLENLKPDAGTERDVAELLTSYYADIVARGTGDPSTTFVVRRTRRDN